MRRLISLLIAVLISALPLLSTQPSLASVSEYDPESLVSIKPELRQTVAENMPSGMTSYDIDVTIPEMDSTKPINIEGTQKVVYTNTTGSPLSELPFRLYANSLASPTPPLTITSVRIAEEEIPFTLSVHDSVATIPLQNPLPAGESIEITMSFTLGLPVNDPTHYGILNYDTESLTAVMAHWYPVVAGRDPITGWMLEPVSIFGDPIFTDAGLYDVSITAPAEQTLITSGVETTRTEQNGQATVEFSASPSRDFVIVTSETLKPTTKEVDGTTITSWALPKNVSGSTYIADWTANTLETFNPLLGDYPWTQLQAVQAPVFMAAAVELPQMFIMGTTFYDQQVTAGSFFEFTVAHEAVHMWFYSLVGNNQYKHAFIDEGITNYLSADVYFRKMYGDDMGDDMRERFLAGDFRRMIEGNADVIVDYPTDSFPSQGAYVNAVYTKAPMGFAAIHHAMGDDDFFAGLRSYVTAFSFRVATPADMEAAFQEHTNIEVRPIWQHWFERREGDQDIQGAAG